MFCFSVLHFVFLWFCVLLHNLSFQFNLSKSVQQLLCHPFFPTYFSDGLSPPLTLLFHRHARVSRPSVQVSPTPSLPPSLYGSLPVSHCICRPLYWWSNLPWDCTAVSRVLCVLITIYSSEAVQPFSVLQISSSRPVLHSSCHGPNAPARSVCACGEASNVKPHAPRKSEIYNCCPGADHFLGVWKGHNTHIQFGQARFCSSDHAMRCCLSLLGSSPT